MFKPLTGRGHAHRLPLTVLLALAASCLIALGSMAALANPTRGATTFVVNRIGDQADLNLANTKCDTSSASGKQCTLRAAIQEANDTAGADVINFNISSASKVIAPATPLPPITGPVTINGYSQPNTSVNTQANGNNAVLRIVLDGDVSGDDSHGFELQANDSVIRGLVIQRWSGAGIFVSGDGNVVAGNFIGTNPSGDAARPNGVGVLIGGDDNRIGGTVRGARNLVSGNVLDGVEINGPGGSDTLVQGNFIGTTRTGATALPNGASGVSVDGSPLVIIGGTAVGARNVISGNGGDGVVFDGAAGYIVQGNYIGTDATGTADLGNQGTGVRVVESADGQIGGGVAGAGNVVSANDEYGIYVLSADGTVIQGNRIGTKADGTGDLGHELAGVFLLAASETLVGGPAGADGNLISGNGIGVHTRDPASTNHDNVVRGNAIRFNDFQGLFVQAGSMSIAGNAIFQNGGDGILVTSTAQGVRIVGNQIFGNAGLGIDLMGGTEDAAGVTANDTDDPDTGANNLQNFPVLSSAMRNSQNGITTVIGTLNSNPSTAFRIELFFVAADPSNHGEGQVFLASQNITTKANGNRSFSIPVAGLSPGHLLTATATSSTVGNTSEFSANLSVVSGP